MRHAKENCRTAATIVQLVLLSSVCSASYISTCHYAGSFCAYDGGDAARRDRAARAGFNISCGDSLSEGIEYCTGPTSRHRCRSVYSTLSGSTRRQLLVESSCITDADVNKCASELCIFSEPLLYVGSGSLPGVATSATSSCCCNVTDNCNAVGMAGTLPTEAPTTPEADSKLGAGTIAGIAIGSIAGIVLVCAAILFVSIRYRSCTTAAPSGGSQDVAHDGKEAIVDNEELPTV